MLSSHALFNEQSLLEEKRLEKQNSIKLIITIIRIATDIAELTGTYFMKKVIIKMLLKTSIIFLHNKFTLEVLERCIFLFF